MSLKDWDKLKEELTMHTLQKTVKVLLNIGANDLRRLNISEAYREGQIVTLDEKVANGLIVNKLAREYDAAVQRDDEEAAKRARDAAVNAAIPAAARELAIEEAKAEAAKLAKAGKTAVVAKPAKPATPENFDRNPHDPQ